MTDRIFRNGGPHNIKHLGNDEYSMRVTIPPDEDGRIARECPDSDCSPGYFKVTPGTGIVTEQSVAYCPYCRHAADPNDYATQEQIRYVTDMALREAEDGVERMFKNALGIPSSGRRKLGGGLLSIEMSYKPGVRSQVRRPYEDEVRRDIICPHCELDHTVFGLAAWCPDCGADIFLAHVAAELDVVRKMLGDVDRRRDTLGKRIAAKDLENCLEDAVSIFEAAMKATVRRALFKRGETVEQVEARLKKLGNTFQSIERTRDKLAGQPLAYCVPDDANWRLMAGAFEKRHPITHNLGVVDRKYLERTQADEQHGREVRVTAAEVEALLAAVNTAVEASYQDLIRESQDA